jgi:hypothetical protein
LQVDGQEGHAAYLEAQAFPLDVFEVFNFSESADLSDRRHDTTTMRILADEDGLEGVGHRFRVQRMTPGQSL